MATRHVIVDGSNIATEGRNMPSLEQLDQAVREFMAENPNDEVTVVVDASFGHRIDPSEVPAFEAAEAAGEVVSPPAGAIGRGDAFLLRIAEKIGATVLSNDSFQEFHGEHVWLFEKGRLVGGKPVPGVGWIFMDRTPVRGAKSREVTKEAKRRKRAETEEAAKAGGDRPGKARTKVVDRAIARATQEVVEPKDGSKSRRRRSTSPPAEPVNEPLAFITFIAAHPLGSEVVGEVVEYSSHGAFIDADGARCYIPLSAMGDPPPRKAREVVTKGAPAPFVVQAFDPQRRGIELALPGFAHLAGSPTAETVEAEIRGDAKAPAGRRTAGRGRRQPAAVADEGHVLEAGVAETAPPAGLAGGEAGPPAEGAPPAEAAEPAVPAGFDGEAQGPLVATAGRPRSPAKKTAAKKAPSADKTASKKLPANKTPAKKTPAKKAPAAEKTAPADEPAKKVAAKKVAAKKAPSATKAPAARKAPAAKKAATTQESAEASAVSTNGPVGSARAAKKSTAAKKTTAANKTTAAKKNAATNKTAAAKRSVPDGAEPGAPRKATRRVAPAPAPADNG